MSPDKRNPNAGQQKGSKTEKIQDLKDAKVSAKDASNVKGGLTPQNLNPQPLPPKPKPPI